MEYPKKKVFSFPKSKFEEVHFSVKSWKGKTFGEIRVFHIEDDGSKVGTEKSIYIPQDKFQEMKEGMEHLIEASQKEKA